MPIVVAEKMGIPGAVVVAEGFLDCAKNTGLFQGVPALQVAVYPGAFLLHSDTQLAKNITTTVLPRVVELLTTPIKEAEAAKKADPRAIAFTGTIDEVNRSFSDKEWSDGMAIIPPTVERVEEFLKYTDCAPYEEIAVLPPGNLRATPWNIAVNAVMAGCRPEYMPILIALVKAIGDPGFSLANLGSTSGVNAFTWLNGPLVRQLDIGYGQGLTFYPPNRVIGATLGLVLRNLAPFKVRENYMGSFGYMQPSVFAEDEQGSPWEPYHVEKGFGKNVSTVTAFSSNVWGGQGFPYGTDANVIMQCMAYELTLLGPICFASPGSLRIVLMTPPVAAVLAAGGYTKQSFKNDLANTGRHVALLNAYVSSINAVTGTPPTFEKALARALARPQAEKGKIPPWYKNFPGSEEIVTIPDINAKNIEFIVCGDPGRNKTQAFAGILNCRISKEIQLPANWDALMAKLGYPPLKSFYL